MARIGTAVDVRSESYLANATHHRRLTEELTELVSRIALGGDERSRARHVDRGKLLPRERVRRVLDNGSPFLEIGQLAGHQLYEDWLPAAGLIAGVEGVDGVFIGPGDLSTSLGFLGQQNHPDVVKVVEETIARIRRTGKHAGILTANEELAHRYIEAGTRFTAVGSDMGLLARTSEALAARFR